MILHFRHEACPAASGVDLARVRTALLEDHPHLCVGGSEAFVAAGQVEDSGRGLIGAGKKSSTSDSCDMLVFSH